MSDILSVNSLCLSFFSPQGESKILNNISFRIRDGEILGLIGNSGCGKSMTAMSIAGLLPDDAVLSGEGLEFMGEDLLHMNPRDRRELLGDNIGVIFQEPMTALDPLCTCGRNLDEVLLIHTTATKDERREQIYKMLERVGFSNPEEIYKRYPHQLSGGQRQRVLIAGAALLKPKLLICDEPTSALDTVTTVQILELLKQLCTDMHISILFISHDLSVVENFCDRVIVMNEGSIVECDITEDVLHNPKSSFTAELLTKAQLNPEALGLTPGKSDYSSDPVLKVRDLSTGYRNGILKSQIKTIVSDIDLDIYKGEIVGLIGSSGCGKTTLTKALCGLLPLLSGAVEFSDSARGLGVVFQDPVSCLNPAYDVRWHLMEPLRARKIKLSPSELDELIIETIKSVGLEERHLSRRPSQLSGGQRQRVAIAMCLILKPDVIIADEPLSSLDASTTASILKLLCDINQTRNTSIILISHNLSIVRSICNRVVVMGNGTIVENIKSEAMHQGKSKEYIALLSAEKKIKK